MREAGVDIRAEQPTILAIEAVQDSDVVITMGCRDTCPASSGKIYLDWGLDNPAGQGIEAVRPIRNEIRRRVTGLIEELRAGQRVMHCPQPLIMAVIQPL